MDTHDCSSNCTSYKSIYDEEAPLVYGSYLFTSTIGFILSVTIIVYQVFYRSMYPYGILTNIAFTLGCLSFFYMINGFTYLFK